MSFKLRKATQEDFSFALRTHHAAYREVIVAQYGTWDQAAQDGYFERSWNANVTEILLCDGQACGYTVVEDRPDDLHVDELVIAPDFQGRGVGTTLLRTAIERAASRGVPVRLRTCHLNRACALYQRLGFREFGRTDTHVLLERR
jgi:ribosomal protein S18 acetylase RimI-like enzyme